MSPGSWSSFEAFASASRAPSGGIRISTAFEMLRSAASSHLRAVASTACSRGSWILGRIDGVEATWSHDDAIEGRDAANARRKQ